MDSYNIQEKTYANTDLLIEQFKNSEKFKALIDSDNARAQDIETAVFEIRSEFEIDNAVGAQLDIIGRIFRVDRYGLSDDDYKMEIKKKSILSYSGEPESIMSILKSQFGASYTKYSPQYPGKYNIITDIEISVSLLDTISPAGVQGLFLTNLVDAKGNEIVDAKGNEIYATIQIKHSFIVDAKGNEIVDANGNNICKVENL